ncbi:hypothetical protein EIP91_000928 [Steccherinum ochraceum]|uniref:Uncharacterized protein n=1 Tax=Steccherinum ochraceum TaxID=92696 RepID=A0A4R0RI57_9APHY|nr:hypothetical protein EIP91_000928 [Steccherinum ochraceum]
MDTEIISSPPTSMSNSSGFLNASYKLATRFLGIPSRVLARMRSLDYILDNHPALQQQQDGLAAGYSSAGPNAGDPRISRLRAGAGAGQAAATVNVPGPWGFLTSGYFVGLFIMAFLLNRIQNIVVPPRSPLIYHNQRTRSSDGTRQRGVMAFLLSFMFPVDLSSTFSRFAFRIPSLYLLGKTLLLWSIVFLEAADVHLSASKWSWIASVGRWTAEKSMEEICWFTFTSVCVTLFVGALTSGLEGFNTTTNQTPFNLFAYSFILYLYTSPAMHVKKPLESGPTRPDKQVVITMILPLLQLMITHCMEIRQKWARLRLIPTSIVGIASLIHFHAVLWIFPSSYPLPNYIPNLVETLLFTITLTTCALNALTQLLLTGAVTKPLFGHTASLMPKWEEDFTVVMFRLGTASLEATSVAGLGNEVSGISATPGRLSRHASDDQPTIELHRSGAMSYSGPGRNAKRGLANEITHIKAGGGAASQPGSWVDSVVDHAWRREVTRFGRTLWRVLKGTWARTWRWWKRVPPVTAGESRTQVVLQRTTPTPHGVNHPDDDYARFLRGEDVSDDEEDNEEFSPRSRSVTPFDAFEDEGESGDEDEDLEGKTGNPTEDGEAVSLYADLALSPSDSGSAHLLLAHMTTTSSPPLTRRRYTRLVSSNLSLRLRDGEAEDDDLDDFILERREDAARRRTLPEEDPTRRNCVICTVEPRQIICWPCRCVWDISVICML